MTNSRTSAQVRGNFQQTQNSKSQESFYPLTNEEWLRITQELKPAEILVLYHLRTLNPFGDRPLTLGVRPLARTLNLDPSTVSRALKRLEQLDYIHLELLAFSVAVVTKGALFERKHTEQPSQTDDHLRSRVLSGDNTLDPYTTPVITTQQIRSPHNTQPLKALTSNSSRLSKTLKTYSNLKRKREKEIEKIDGQNERLKNPNDGLASVTPLKAEENVPAQKATGIAWDKFSAPGADPEFFEFVVRRAAKFQNPVPADVRCAAESWIRKQGHLLYRQYLDWQASQRQAEQRQIAATVEVTAPPQAEPEVENLEERLGRYQKLWENPICRLGIRNAIAAHPQWGICIGQNGPQWAMPVEPEPPVEKVKALLVQASAPAVLLPVLEPSDGIPDDFADVLVGIDLHVRRLGWDCDRVMQHLKSTYGKCSRQLLEGYELLNYLFWLQDQPQSSG